MDKNHRIKALILSLFSTSMLSSVAAAPFGSSQAWNTGAAVNTIVGVANFLTWYEIQNSFDAIFFAATWLALYFISVKFIETIWELISKRIKRGSGGRFSPGLGSSGDGPDSYEKGLAAVVSLIGTQYIGPALAPLIGFTWGLFGLILAIAVWAIFRNFLAGSMTSSNATSPDGGVVPDSSSSSMGDIEDQLERVKDAADKTGSEVKDSEANDNLDEGEDAAEKVQGELKGLKNVEMEIEELLEADEGDLENAIREAQELLEAESEEEKDISDIQQRLQRAARGVETINTAVKMAEEGEISVSRTEDGHLRVNVRGGGSTALVNQAADALSSKGLDPQLYGSQYWGLKQVWEEDIQGIEKDVQDELGIEQKEAKEVSDEVQRVEREAQRFRQAYQLIQELKSVIQEVENEDKALEQLAKQDHDEKLAKEVGLEEKEEGELQQMFKDLLSKEEMIEEELEKAGQLLEKELEPDVEEEQQIQTEIKEATKIDRELQALERHFGSNFDYENAQATDQRIEAMREAIEKIDQQMGNVEGLTEQEIQKLREAESMISEALNQ
ncbi:MAG: hypothetical protein ABEJ99_05785 [Candidatus Nanohaloarchaea archaeon]